jgi:hypothetical protein
MMQEIRQVQVGLPANQPAGQQARSERAIRSQSDKALQLTNGFAWQQSVQPCTSQQPARSK